MSYRDNQQNGAITVFEPRSARNRAILDRMAFSSDAEIRASEKAERDELEAKKLAEKAVDAKRTMGKYAASLEALADLFRRLEGERDLTSAERAMTESLVREHQRVMAETLREFCGDSVDAERLVSDDTGKLRECIASQLGSRRGRPSSDQHRDETGKLPNRFCPDQD
jgi:hypothetical protein